ncbi:hypothetical protein CL653_00255 [bacterium]|nr:hypothetical protein [bacterium]|tara:strand:- start:2311 stop:2679 length:369 start_codon:yes stop_codon:yes gene_type:complete
MKYQLPNWLSKAFEADKIYVSILLVSISLSSFGVGRLSIQFESKSERQPVSLYASLANSKEPDSSGVNTQTGKYVASVSGSKYHLISCGSANQIAEKNRIYFVTEEDARAGGYERAGNCKGW